MGRPRDDIDCWLAFCQSDSSEACRGAARGGCHALGLELLEAPVTTAATPRRLHHRGTPSRLVAL